MYRNLVIYYFSGTGNSLRATHWIADEARRQGLSVHIYSIDRFTHVPVPTLEGETLIGFCSPTHGFCLPWLMLKFLFRFPKLSNADVFLLNTRAGFKIWKFFLPGISGIANLLPMFMLWLKGYATRGVWSLDMPQSWISISPPVNGAAIRSINTRCQEQTEYFTRQLLTGKRCIRPMNWFTLPIDLALIPITVGYLFIGRFFLAKTLYSSYKCDGCGLCEKFCPVHSIVMEHKRPYWLYNCESCMRCMNICPKQAIQSLYTRWAVIFYLLFVFVVLPLNINTDLFFTLGFFICFPIYRGLMYILRVKIINRIFTLTSLTYYWKRYLATGVKTKDFKTVNQ